MWWSELRAGWMAATSDPWRVFFSTSQTQEQWSANGLPVQQLSIAAQCCIHNNMQTPGWRHLLLYGSCWIFHRIAIFRVSLHISSAGWEVREDALEVRERERRAEDEQKEDTNSAKSRCRERWKEEMWVSAPSSSAAASPASLLCRDCLGRPLRLLRSHSLLHGLTVLVLPDRVICHFITNWLSPERNSH